MGLAIRTSQQAKQSLPAWITLLLLMASAAFLVPSFVTPRHLLSVMQQVTPLLLVAVGQTFAVLTRGLDLSVGSVVTLSMVLASGVMRGDESAVLAGVGASLLAGIGVGLLNGLAIAHLKISPVIVTLATMSVVQGIAWVYSGGAPKGAVAEMIRFLANGSWGAIPVASVVFLGAVLFSWLLLSKTVFGRHLYTTGSNPAAARLAGVSTARCIVSAYTLSGAFAALGGLMLAGYVGVGSLDAGDRYILDSIAAVIIGGTTFAGGRGGVIGTAAGVCVLAVLTAILIQLQTPTALRSVLLSLILVAAAILHVQRRGG